MNIQKITIGVVFAFILAIFAASCIKDEIDLENISNKMYWNPKLGAPVAYGNLSLEDLIEMIDSEQVVREDSNKFITLVYSNTILSSDAATILKIDNQHFNEVLLESQYSLPPLPIEDTIVLNRSSQYTFAFTHGEVIDSIKLKTGIMVFNVSSSYKFSGSLQIVVPGFVKNNKPFEIKLDINKADGTFTTTQNYDLSGYKLQLEHPNINDNLVSYSFTAKLVNQDGGVSVGDNISISIDFNNVSFSSLYGYVGQRQLLNTQSEFSIPLFKNVTQPKLRFKDPLIRLRTTSSFGVPASVELYNVVASNDKSSQSIPLTFSPGINPFQISYPSSIGKSALDTAIFSKGTTNLYSALEIGPNKILYGIRSFSNPAGKVSNYVTDSSKISVDLDVELPLDMSTSLVEFTDTMELDLSSILEDNVENIKSLLLHTSFENGMPIDLNLQVYFLNGNYNHVDTLFNQADQNIIKSGVVDQQGKITSSSKKDVDLQYSHSQIDLLKTVKYAIVKAGVETANGGNTFVKFYSNYSINVHFGVQTELEIKE